MASRFAGFVALGSTITVDILTTNSSGSPVNGDSLPTYRVYGPAGLMYNGTGTTSFKDTGSITGATNASPIVITSNSHGLTTGTRVTITGVGGNTAANSTFVITRVDANSFSLDSSTGNGSYTSGGTWNVSGLYKASIDATAGNSYAQGICYSVLVSYAISSTQRADVVSFVVT